MRAVATMQLLKQSIFSLFTICVACMWFSFTLPHNSYLMLPKHWDCWPRPMLPKRSLWPCDSYLFNLYMSCYKCRQPYWEGPWITRRTAFYLLHLSMDSSHASFPIYYWISHGWHWFHLLFDSTTEFNTALSSRMFGLFRLLTLAGLEVYTISPFNVWMIFGSQRKYVYQAVGQIWPRL